ncbi:ssDNA-binding protein, mitochondrial [Friedmanniomyces endolithicus]|uniref:SsDNA-binding protein, mitochondrial n=1 Tax=Rachicladosporium monterosium TaxID=1507873 RepID=A0ABR0KY75_9PEZI|nr:ssDNA-binding protein, mitochondrial [Friedmanniomyces endolithicus]KAK1092196.1 ssDNA-binding protein, mitochondrial [Friedmanniomyces endolithicus]KAK5140568.1 ssDNA-binding protein, mitochondrial [Rachicladosporium monterosium]
MLALRQLPRFVAAPLRTTAAAAFSTSPARPLSKMQLIGRLADSPELTPTSTGRDVIRYALGVSSGPRGEDGNRATSWFRIASFVEGAQRELLLSLPKGTQMYVEAEAKMDTYQAQDGSNRTQLNLLQRSFEALARPQNRSEDSTTGAESETNVVEEPLSGVGAS